MSHSIVKTAVSLLRRVSKRIVSIVGIAISMGMNTILQRNTTLAVAHDSKPRLRSLNHVSGKAIYSP